MSLFYGILRVFACALVGGLVLPLAACAQTDNGEFDDWLVGLKKEAIERGIRPATVRVHRHRGMKDLRRRVEERR